jgi:hypothetical protein
MLKKGSQLRSRLVNILNVPQMVRLRYCWRLQPCWIAFLSILPFRPQKRK